MLLTIGFAFLAGVITVLSPCVLPLLPLILASATQQGRARPIGVVLGFIGTFTAATLALSFLVRALGVPPDLNRTLAASVLLLLGLVLLVPALHQGFERWVGALAGRVPAGQAGNGFGGGLVVGTGLGLAWSPCVGPIMASVITLALNQQVQFATVLVTLAFALGTALPMAAIMIGGRRLVGQLKWFQIHAKTIQQVFGLVLLLTGLAIVLGWDRAIQIQLLNLFPGWEAALTTWEPRPTH